MTSRGVVGRGVLAFAALGALLPGCASTTSAPPIGATVAPVPAGSTSWLCNLDSLFWSHRFVERADARNCVVVLESVRIGD